MSSTGSLTRVRTLASTNGDDQADHDAAAGRPARSRSPTVQTVTVAAIAAIAVRRATRAVASLSRLSPSRIDTIRRGMPTRRAMVVAATASGGADDRAERQGGRDADTPGITLQATRPTTSVVKTTAPTARMPIACAVRADVDQRGADRRGVEQGRQEADEDHLGVDPVVGHARDERGERARQRRGPAARTGPGGATTRPPPRRRRPARGSAALRSRLSTAPRRRLGFPGQADLRAAVFLVSAVFSNTILLWLTHSSSCSLHPLRSQISSRYFSSRLEKQGGNPLRVPLGHAVSMKNAGIRLQCGRSDPVRRLGPQCGRYEDMPGTSTFAGTRALPGLSCRG